MGVSLANFKQSRKIPGCNDKLALILLKIEVENVLILLGLIIRERIISSTSAEDTGAKSNELA